MAYKIYAVELQPYGSVGAIVVSTFIDDDGSLIAESFFINPDMTDNVYPRVTKICKESLEAICEHNSVSIDMDQLILDEALGQAKITVYEYMQGVDANQAETANHYHMTPNIKEQSISLLARFSLRDQKQPLRKIAELTRNENLNEVIQAFLGFGPMSTVSG